MSCAYHDGSFVVAVVAAVHSYLIHSVAVVVFLESLGSDETRLSDSGQRCFHSSHHQSS